MTRAWTVAAIVLASGALDACISKVPIEGASCPCPSGYCCDENSVCVQRATCDSTGGTGGGGAGGSGRAGAGGSAGGGTGGTVDGGGDCNPTARRCNGGRPQKCDANGAWQDVGLVCLGACVDGLCTATCAPDATQCSGPQPQKCDANGAWQDMGAACANLCASGACGGGAGGDGQAGAAAGGVGGGAGAAGATGSGSAGAGGGAAGSVDAGGGAAAGAGGAAGASGSAGTGGAAGASGSAGTGRDGGMSTDGSDGDGDGGAGFHAACDPSITDDDRAVHITSASGLTSARGNLLLNIFNSATLPNPTVPATNIHLNVSPSTVPAGLRNELGGLLGQLSNIGRVDMLEYPMKDTGGNVVFTSLAWHFIPASGGKSKLVIVHQGHDYTLIDPFPGEDAGGPGGRGLAATIDALLFDGYSVLAMYMPGYRPELPDDLATPNHAYLMNDVQPQGGGSGTRFFMEPVRAFLSYLETNSARDGFPRYSDFHMTGVEGGGWTTTVYAAIDPTIEHSFPIAGSIPLHLRCPTGGASAYNHDAEQFQGNGIYQIAGYQDLYVLGATGTSANGFPRHQTQILDRLDDCCFGEAQQAASLGPWDESVNQYELAVRNAVYDIGQGGMFRVEIDETDVSADGKFHRVGHGQIFRTILGELDDARRVIGRQAGNSPGNDNDAFYRGVDGNLWHRSISDGIEEDTFIPIVGVSDAAFAAGDPALLFNVVARNLQSAPVIASTFQSSGGLWTYRTLSGRLNNDPTIVPGQGNSELWIFGLGTNDLPYVWDNDGRLVQISTTRVLGPLSASLRQFEQGFHVFYMAWDRSVVHSYRADPQAPWQTESLGGITLGFPAGTVVPSTGDLAVFNIGTDGMLYWNRKPNGDQMPSNQWTGWQSISYAAGATGTVLMGTPSFSLTSSGTWTVFVPTSASGGLVMFTSSSTGAWTFNDLGGDWISAPVATATGVFTEGKTTGLWQWLSNGFTLLGGLFD